MELSKDLYLSILENAHGRELEINGRKYTTKQVHPVLEPVPQTLRIHTLSGLIDYLETIVMVSSSRSTWLWSCLLCR